MKGLLNMADTTVTIKDSNGQSITMKSPEGTPTNFGGILGGPVNTQSSASGYQGGGLIGGPYYGPTADNVDIRANPGEFVLNVPASQNPQFRPTIEAMNNWGRQQLAKGGYTKEPGHYAVGGDTTEEVNRKLQLQAMLGAVTAGSLKPDQALSAMINMGIRPGLARQYVDGALNKAGKMEIAGETVRNQGLMSSIPNEPPAPVGNTQGFSKEQQAFDHPLKPQYEAYYDKVISVGQQPIPFEEWKTKYLQANPPKGSVAPLLPLDEERSRGLGAKITGGYPALGQPPSNLVQPPAGSGADIGFYPDYSNDINPNIDRPELLAGGTRMNAEQMQNRLQQSADAGTLPKDMAEAQKQEINDDVIAKATPERVSKAMQGKTDKKLQENASKIIGDSTGIADAIRLLDEGIEKQESKRDSVKLMAFGLSMLAGNGMNSSIQAANSVGNFNEDRINALYANRKQIQDEVNKKALGDALGTRGSAEFGTGWEGSDGNIYFDPNQVPENVRIVGKAGTKDPNVPTKWVGVQTKAIEGIREANVKQAKITNVLRNIPEDVWSGVFGSTEAKIEDIFGSQDEANVWRTQVRDLVTSDAISNLPPGVASDKDIELVMKAQIDGFANPEALKQFFAAVQRISNYEKRYNQALSDYIETNKTGAGFEPPAYDPQGKDQATEGVITSKTNNQEVDLDLSNLGG